MIMLTTTIRRHLESLHYFILTCLFIIFLPLLHAQPSIEHPLLPPYNELLTLLLQSTRIDRVELSEVGVRSYVTLRVHLIYSRLHVLLELMSQAHLLVCGQEVDWVRDQTIHDCSLGFSSSV